MTGSVAFAPALRFFQRGDRLVEVSGREASGGMMTFTPLTAPVVLLADALPPRLAREPLSHQGRCP